MKSSQIFCFILCWFLMEFVMVSFSCPIMKIVSIHDINYNKDVPLAFAIYDNNNIGNVQVAHEGEELSAFTIQQT